MIASLAPSHGPAAATITILGSYFCAQPDAEDEGTDPSGCKSMGSVSFGAVPATVTQYSDTSVMVEVPGLPIGSVDVKLVVVGRSSNRATFVIE